MNKKLLIGLVFILLFSLTSAFAVGTAPDPADTVAYWKLEDLTDATGNGYTLTNSGATSGATGIIDNAYDLGTRAETKYLYRSSETFDFVRTTEIFTINFWWKPNNFNNNDYNYLLSAGSAGSQSHIGWELVYDDRTAQGFDETLRFVINKGSTGTTIDLRYDNAIADNNYHMITLTGDGTTARMYIDGSLVAFDSFGTQSTGTATYSTFYIGAIETVKSSGQGIFDEVSVFDVALTSDEIAYLYQSGSPTSAQQYPFTAPSPSSPDILLVQVKDADSGLNVNNVTVWFNNTAYTNTTGNQVSINVTADGFNGSELQNFTVGAYQYYNVSVTGWNISSTYIANLTGYPLEDFSIITPPQVDSFETGLDDWSIVGSSCYSTPAISSSWSSLGNKSLKLTSQIGIGGCAAQVEKVIDDTTLYLDYRISASTGYGYIYIYDDGVLIYSDGSTTTKTVTNASISFASGSTIRILSTSQPGWGSDLYIDNVRTAQKPIITDDLYNITWSEAVSPTGKTVTYNGTITYQDNGTTVGTFSTTNLYYQLNLTSYSSEDYIVTVLASEQYTLDSFEHIGTFAVDRPNYLYFYNENTGDPIEGANITINLPNYGTDLELVTNAQGYVTFDSYYNNTLQTGTYTITFEDFIGYVTPITFSPTYSSLPVNESFNITVTNINVSIYFRSNFTTFNKNATVTIEGITQQITNNGSVYIVNASILNGEYRLTVSADGYFNEEKVFTYTGQTDLDLDIYMLELNSSTSGTVTVRTVDEFSRLLDNSQVNLLQYDPSTLSYIEVSECYTDSNGECKFIVQTNTKSYKFTASRGVNGNTVTASTNAQIFADDISGGQIVLFSEQTITLTLSSTQQYTMNPTQNIIYDVTESFNNVTNQSNIDVSFRTIDGTSMTVCVEYFSIEGGIETSLTGTTFCVTGSSAEVTENAFFTLNRSKEYVAKVYIKTTSGEISLNTFRYISLSSFAQKLQDNLSLPFFVLFIWIFLIAGSLLFKNVPLTGVVMIVGTWIIWFVFPNIAIASASVLQTLLGLSLIYVGRKKEDFN